MFPPGFTTGQCLAVCCNEGDVAHRWLTILLVNAPTPTADDLYDNVARHEIAPLGAYSSCPGMRLLCEMERLHGYEPFLVIDVDWALFAGLERVMVRVDSSQLALS